MKQMEELEGKFIELFQSAKPKIDDLNQTISLIESGRSSLVNLILGPKFIGDEESFRAYRIIHKSGTGGRCHGLDNPQNFDRTYFFQEGDKEQILLRVNYELFSKGHYHTALVRHIEKGNIDVYEAAVGIGNFEVPNPSYGNWLNMEWVKGHMDHCPIDELVRYDPKNKLQMTYRSFLRAVISATELLLDALPQEKETAKKLYRDVRKLQAVAGIEHK